MNIAIIGCGLIGQKRARGLGQHRLVIAADVSLDKAKAIASLVDGAIATKDWREAVRHTEVEIVIVATTNNCLAEITLEAVRAGKHVLVEKPAARSAKEILPILDAIKEAEVFVKVGFNHRYHPGLQKARQIYDSGDLGKLMFIRGRYGHGGRLGYEQEWRAIPEISGGGELLDQGVHLIDLARWFLGEFNQVDGFAENYYWNMPVEDNGFVMLKTPLQQVAWLHASCTEWKNMFSFEIYGQHGKVHIEGLGGSYGVERVSYYKMLPQMGPPETSIWEYPFPDDSWQLEFDDFVRCIQEKVEPMGTLTDAKEILTIVEKIYGGSGR